VPQNLRDHHFKIAYGPGDDRLKDFYIPALSCAVRYDRSAGFFSSSALAVAAAGVAHLIANGGRMRLLVGAQLSPDDVKALQGGADLAALVADRMVSGLEEKVDALARERLAALAWMIREGTLEVRVVLPKGPDGRPLPADQSRDYYHPKSGIFTDANGDQVAFSGSINESAQGWEHNYEQFMVYRSWIHAVVPYITQVRLDFESLWKGERDRDWIAVELPRAVREGLLRYCPSEPPSKDSLEVIGVAESEGEPEPQRLSADTRERIIFQFLRDAPFLSNGGRLGEVASTVRYWPHQARVVQRVVDTYPKRYLLCDEVGLGKTIEGGGIAKQLLLSGRVRRCLILAPKGVCRQWQEELYEKFLLNVPRYDGGRFVDYFERELPTEAENPWNAFPFIIASSHLAKRRERMGEVLSADPWDLVLVDEAHHARRKDFISGQYRRNRLLSLLLGPQENPSVPGLAERTRGLILMTATPMQIDPREVWDLLTVLGLGGRWGASDDNFVRFFDEIRQGAEADWRFVLRMVRDYLDQGGEVDASLAEAAQKRVGLVTWETIRNLPYADRIEPTILRLDEAGRAVLLEFVRRHTPLAGLVFRNTRALLKEYRRRGLLKENVPERRPEPAWISMRPEERELYDRIEEYISEFYKKYEAERTGLGFVMTVYRRRLTSSFYAIARSLERRLEFLRGGPDAAVPGGLVDEDFEEEDLDEDILEKLAEVDRSIYREEMAYVENFLAQLRLLDVDSKVEQLQADLRLLLERRETVIVFTLYTDTMDYLRDKLRSVYGAQVACYSGRGGEVWDGEGWKRVTKERIKADFREEKIKILLGTDALSEGLNLQTCGVMVNYDMPWNPMRVEQRIGRIDRIGQRYDEVWIRNYFYEDTVEANVYRALEGRIQWFEAVVGPLQPILARVAHVIKAAAMESGTAREAVLARELEAIRRDIEQQRVTALDLDEYVSAAMEQRSAEAPPVTQSEIERTFLESPALEGRFLPHPEIAGAYHLWVDGMTVSVTFDAEVFDAHPATLRLLGYSDELFQRLLESVDAPEGSVAPWVVRLSVDEPPMRGYYVKTDEGAAAVTTLAALAAALEQEVPPLDAGQIAAARAGLEARAAELLQRERAVEKARKQTAEVALQERGRQVLLQATYIDLAMSAHPELFGASPNSAGFTEEAVRALKRHGYPFAPLIRLVGTEGIVPVPTDPFYMRIQDSSLDGLRKRFEAAKGRATEIVAELAHGSTSPRA